MRIILYNREIKWHGKREIICIQITAEKCYLMPWGDLRFIVTTQQSSVGTAFMIHTDRNLYPVGFRKLVVDIRQGYDSNTLNSMSLKKVKSPKPKVSRVYVTKSLRRFIVHICLKSD